MLRLSDGLLSKSKSSLGTFLFSELLHLCCQVLHCMLLRPPSFPNLQTALLLFFLCLPVVHLKANAASFSFLFWQHPTSHFRFHGQLSYTAWNLPWAQLLKTITNYLPYNLMHQQFGLGRGDDFSAHLSCMPSRVRLAFSWTAGFASGTTWLGMLIGGMTGCVLFIAWQASLGFSLGWRWQRFQEQ